ncbi:hypothetical protein LRS05_02890 [Flavobacterium sp. J372]|uniref:hypothetical protein n=1 Tax=Flavobacterium sp. J372 TaxID=2898436 RepID=UPI002150CD23|nr:hypothetical protein [Flavobacterium sp. J372]MCR5861154.1 hypothetical protein [Flavobacterium sp. J372]
MEDIVEKNRIVQEWLGEHHFFNIKNSSDNCFIRADGYKNRMVIAIRGDYEINEKEILEFAARNHRQAWIANINDEEIEWETL